MEEEKCISVSAIEDAKGKYPILKFFGYAHLPTHLRSVSRQFSDVAFNMAVQLPQNAESSVALRKLLEAKDAAVRATLPS